MSTNSKKWAIALAISVGLNLFLAGLFVAGRYRHGFSGGPPHPVPSAESAGPHAARPGFPEKNFDARRTNANEGQLFLRELIQALGGPQDPRVKKIWGTRQQDLFKYRESSQASREAVQSALTREPFDAEALRLALHDLQKTTDEAQARSAEAIVSLAGELTPEERRALGEKRERRRPPEGREPRRVPPPR